MTHLDVGFTNYARNVCDLYFEHHFPKAIKTSADLRALGGDAQFRYTSHPWLVSELLHGTAGCAQHRTNETQLAATRAAIGRGDIAWHGKPMNIFPELAGRTLFEAGLSIATALNAEFNTSWGTATAKSTDVPGLSRSVVPIMARHGLKAVHMGFNSACLMADIPLIFTWKDEASGTSLIGMAEDNYGTRIVVHGVPGGFPTALVFQYTLDNGSPPNASQVQEWWATQQKVYPNAKVRLGSLDSFATAVTTKAAAYLPVVTGDVGDSWLYGSPADPYKLAGLREACRLHASLVSSGTLSADDPDMRRFDARLLKPPEHNWGLSVGQYFPQLRTPTGNWSNAAFHAAQPKLPQYAMLEAGWVEERSFLTPLPDGTPAERLGMGLPPSPSPGWLEYKEELAHRLPQLRQPTPPSLDGLRRVSLDRPRVQGAGAAAADTDAYSFKCGGAGIGFRALDGAISELTDAAGRKWASPDSLLGHIQYETYNMDQYNRFNEGYNPGCGPPCGDFSKGGMSSADPQDKVWALSLAGLWYRPAASHSTHAAGTPSASQQLQQLQQQQQQHHHHQLPRRRQSALEGCEMVLHLVPPPEASAKYGAPRDFWVTASLLGAAAGAGGGAALDLNVTVSWFNKTSTRLAESTWASFAPLVPAQPAPGSPGWRMDVLGSEMDPLDVVVNGTRHLHGVWDGVSYDGGGAGTVVIESLDAPVVAPGDIDHLLLFSGDTQPVLTGGFHWSLHNNLWGTAFPQWYSDDATFRFRLTMSS